MPTAGTGGGKRPQPSRIESTGKERKLGGTWSELRGTENGFSGLEGDQKYSGPPFSPEREKKRALSVIPISLPSREVTSMHEQHPRLERIQLLDNHCMNGLPVVGGVRTSPDGQ